MNRIRIAGAGMELEVLPEIGGKIASLRSVTTGREWLWLNPHLPSLAPGTGESCAWESEDMR